MIDPGVSLHSMRLSHRSEIIVSQYGHRICIDVGHSLLPVVFSSPQYSLGTCMAGPFDVREAMSTSIAMTGS